MIRLLYALYAFVVLFFAWRFHGENMPIDVTRKITIALWIAALVAVFAEWKYAKYLAAVAFLPVFAFFGYEFWARQTMGGALTLNQWIFEMGLAGGGIALCFWLFTSKRL